MFKRRPKQTSPTPPRELFTYIHKGTTLNGELAASGRVRLHGTVLGNIRVEGVLEVAEAGRVEGEWIVADEVKIIGHVQVQSLIAHGKVEIWRGGELIGDVKAASLDIEEGARFTGRSEMTVQADAVGEGSRDAEQSVLPTAPEHPPRAVGTEQPRIADAEEPASAALELLGQSDDATF